MLAALNAFVLRALLFGDEDLGRLSPRSHIDGGYTWQNPSPEDTDRALGSLARIIFNAASGGYEDGNGGAGSNGTSSC